MCLFINIMTNESNKICEETNLQKIGNLIKIPYYDLLEESKTYSPFQINGFSIIELDETNEDLYPDDDIPDIETKKGFQLKKKAEYVENYYMNYTEEELSNVHCSRCYMNGFSNNELLYFKDRKSLISYLKYCFIFLKKNLFMDHSIYMNNRYDLFKIDHTYLIGFHFLIPKTICKSCFIQLINKKFLISEMKNEITDYDKGIYDKIVSPKKNLNLLKKKRKRKENNLNSEKKEKNKDNFDSFSEEKAIKSIQISPIVIPLSKNETPKKKIKRKRIGKFGIKKKKKRNIKINIKKYNENVIYDKTNNALIINKKNLKNLELIEENEVKSGNLDSIKININIKEKEKIFISSKQEEIKKIVTKEKSVKNMNMNINKEKNEKFMEKFKKKKKEKSIDKNTIIINKINNSNGIGDININKIGLTQINNNNINNSLSNNMPIVPIYLLNPQKICIDTFKILNYLSKIMICCDYIFNKMKENPFTRIEYIIVQIISNLIENINYKINENRILIEHALLIIKINLDKYQQISHDKTLEINYQKLVYLEQYAVNTLKKYKIIEIFCFEGLSCLNNILRDGNLFNTQMEQKINN